MAFPLFEHVILTIDHPEHDLCAGDVDTVVERHIVAERVDGYSVEYFDMTGRTIAALTLPESELRLPSQNDRPAVRVLTTT